MIYDMLAFLLSRHCHMLACLAGYATSLGADSHDIIYAAARYYYAGETRRYIRAMRDSIQARADLKAKRIREYMRRYDGIVVLPVVI